MWLCHCSGVCHVYELGGWRVENGLEKASMMRRRVKK